MGEELTSRDRTLLIQEMAKRQDAEIASLRGNVDAFRSIFGRLQVFAEQGWIDVKGDGSRWISTEAIMEILSAVGLIINDAPKSNNPPFGINRLGDVSVVSGGIGSNRVVAVVPNPLDY